VSNGTLTKVTARTAAEVCKHFALGEEAARLLRDGLTPRQFLDQLLERQLFPDAARFLAHALPKREAVWWACLCSRAAAGANPPAKPAAAQRAAEKWVADPSEENRRAAQAAADEATLGAPAGCAAMAAFWSGGSMAPPGVPAVPPGEHLTAHGVSGAVMLAAVLADPATAPEKYRRFFAQGLEVASGASRWK
jgi:hypothetical protein